MNVTEHFVPRMKDLIIDSFLSTKTQLNPNRRKNSFELLGYDFLIDEDFRLWLIEINTNPYFGVPNTYIGELLPKMIDNLFDIVLDPVFPPANKPESKFHSYLIFLIDCLKPNEFELIYCESNSVHS